MFRVGLLSAIVSDAIASEAHFGPAPDSYGTRQNVSVTPAPVADFTRNVLPRKTGIDFKRAGCGDSLSETERANDSLAAQIVADALGCQE